jgi:hypothetical protein
MPPSQSVSHQWGRLSVDFARVLRVCWADITSINPTQALQDHAPCSKRRVQATRCALELVCTWTDPSGPDAEQLRSIAPTFAHAGRGEQQQSAETTTTPHARRPFRGRAERDNGSSPCELFGPSPSLVAERWLAIAERRSSGHSSSSIAASILPSWAHEWDCHSVLRVDGDVVHALVADDIARPPSPPLALLRFRVACGVLTSPQRER